MSNSYFEFQHFVIHHDRCSMKVGTDGVLLGAWAELPQTGKVLDVGTGSGLIALMVAQRGTALKVTGIDIDAVSIEQARENVQASPYAERVTLVHQSLQQFVASMNGDKSIAGDDVYHAEELFDAIVCNPPFFEETLLPPDKQRAQARHTDTLPFASLIECSARLLRHRGSFHVILPTSAFETFRLLCFQHDLFLCKSCFVYTSARKSPKRVLASFVHGAHQVPQTTSLLLTDGNGRSADYRQLTRDFYIR